MNDYRTISVDRRESVDWLTLNRPDRLNALDDTMVGELWRYFDQIDHDTACRIIVIRGAGRGFCAGLDLKSFTPPDPERDGSSPSDDIRSLTGIVAKMRNCPQPIVALIHGAACGGGLSIALAADIRIAGRTAKMNVAYVKLGLSGCELGTSYYLPRNLGGSLAAELMMTGRFLGADRALATGLVSVVTEDEGMEAYAAELVGDMLKASPIGLTMTKRTMNAAARVNDVDEIIALEQQTQELCSKDPTFLATVAAFNASR